ncbi:hypothetical protein HDE76_000566 [Rhodanobacter sp. ANJX3]|nr:hypothetical protein [Rhodanobacter sp. ANJX3]NYE27432.1 hypothetical protein [Rhodanobacter sp. K2T2]
MEHHAGTRADETQRPGMTLADGQSAPQAQRSRITINRISVMSSIA